MFWTRNYLIEKIWIVILLWWRYTLCWIETYLDLWFKFDGFNLCILATESITFSKLGVQSSILENFSGLSHIYLWFLSKMLSSGEPVNYMLHQPPDRIEEHFFLEFLLKIVLNERLYQEVKPNAWKDHDYVNWFNPFGIMFMQALDWKSTFRIFIWSAWVSPEPENIPDRREPDIRKNS